MGWGPWYQERKQSRLDIENDDDGFQKDDDDAGDDGFRDDDDDAGDAGFHDDAGDGDCIGTS